MAVRLPSDLITDVIKNADSSRRASVVARLQSASEKTNIEFARATDRVVKAGSRDEKFDLTEGSSGALSASEAGKAGSAYRSFERMVLGNLFEAILPDEKSGAFGSDMSAGVWRSLAADQFAGVYANAGGIGIEKMLLTREPSTSIHRDGHWPYFGFTHISAMSG